MELVEWLFTQKGGQGAFLAAIAISVVKMAIDMASVKTNLNNYCQESKTDRVNLWNEHGKLRQSHSEHGERLTAVETKVELRATTTRGRPQS